MSLRASGIHVLWAAVAVLGLLHLLSLRRFSELEAKLARPSAPLDGRTQGGFSPRLPTPAPLSQPPLPATIAAAPAPLASSSVTVDQVEEIARRVVKDTPPPRLAPEDYVADPMGVLERELSLGSAQRGQIEQLRRDRDAVYLQLVRNDPRRREPAIWEAHFLTAMNGYEAALKGVLLPDQQKKYLQIRREGKFFDTVPAPPLDD